MLAPVTVIIPTFNRAALLVETIDSVLAQSTPPAEVIIVDDGSSDGTADAVAKFGDHIRYVPTENGGVCRARNIGASLATQPYLALCDSDDLWHESKIERQIDLHRNNPGLGYSFTNFSVLTGTERSRLTKFDQAAPAFQRLFAQSQNGSLVVRESFYDLVLDYQPIFPSTVFMTREFFAEVGSFREELGRMGAEDLEFTLRCVNRQPVGILTDPLVLIRKHEGNDSRDDERQTLGEIHILKLAAQYHQVSQHTLGLIQEQIFRRTTDASYYAFRAGDFVQHRQLLEGVPSEYLDKKDKLKLTLGSLPRPLALLAHRLMAQ